MESASEKKLRKIAHDVAQTIIDISFTAHVGHIGSALSISDILTVLYFDGMGKNDKFILSKGHAGSALYATLYHKGILTKRELESFGDKTDGLCEHPERKTKGVEMTSGSLGYGLGYGAGLALAAKKNVTAKTSLPHVYVLISDGECGEGSVWEAALFAAAHHLDNLTVIIDANGWQCFGKTDDITGVSPLLPKFEAFGFAGSIVDGHTLPALSAAFHRVPFKTGKPSVIVANTVSGHGMSLFENKLEAHYQTLSNEQYLQAQQDISARYDFL